MIRKHIGKMPARKRDTHKGDFGHVFIIAGSTGMTGAAYLASQAALLSGSGLVTCGIPERLNVIMEVKLTEVMTIPLDDTKEGSLAATAKKEILTFSQKCDSVAIGPGISRNSGAKSLVRNVLTKIDKPLVLDADGIIAIVESPGLLKKRKAPTVLTPHPGEMSRLIGKDARTVQENRESVAREFAKKNGVILVLKGHRTVVASPGGEIYINKTGNSGMSTAGVGDVLTGMIASFIGQGLEPYSAAVIGVYLHGLAGDIAAREKGQLSLIAGDVLSALPQAIKNVL